jgi:hypothetical protein
LFEKSENVDKKAHGKCAKGEIGGIIICPTEEGKD